jgi:NADPH:quinone reductase-like Zn-dependent oxidoreductase
VIYLGTGGPEVVGVGERAVRDPGPGEIRIAVRAAAVNPSDLVLREHGTPVVPPPWTPGMDAAGVVEAVGPGVERLDAGDAVMAAMTPRRPEGGAQCELVVVPAASAVPLPKRASFSEAATLPMNGLTARLALELLDLAPGQTLAVSGGAGLLAAYAIPLARDRGLRVLADAAPDDTELVRGFGADVVIPRGDDFPGAVRALTPDGADGVLDTALLYRAAIGAVRHGGVLAVVRGWDGPPVVDGVRIVAPLVAGALERTDWLEELREYASQGTLALRVVDELPLEEAAEAQRRMAAGGVRGRLVLMA